MGVEPTKITWESIPVSTWSDALDRLRIPAVASGLRHVAGGRAFAGRAVTVREEVAPLGGHPPEAFDVHAILQVIEKHSVLVIDAVARKSRLSGALRRAPPRGAVSPAF